MDSFPGPDNVGTNGAHWKLKQLLQGKKYPEEVLVYLNDTLDYRLSAVTLASQYVSFLDIQFPDGLMFDTEAWCNNLALNVAKDGDSKGAKSKLEKYEEVRGYIMDTKLFDRPMSFTRIFLHQTLGVSCHRTCRVVVRFSGSRYIRKSRCRALHSMGRNAHETPVRQVSSAYAVPSRRQGIPQAR
jgi:hypothetical protein